MRCNFQFNDPFSREILLGRKSFLLRLNSLLRVYSMVSPISRVKIARISEGKLCEGGTRYFFRR